MAAAAASLWPRAQRPLNIPLRFRVHHFSATCLPSQSGLSPPCSPRCRCWHCRQSGRDAWLHGTAPVLHPTSQARPWRAWTGIHSRGCLHSSTGCLSAGCQRTGGAGRVLVAPGGRQAAWSTGRVPPAPAARSHAIVPAAWGTVAGSLRQLVATGAPQSWQGPFCTG